MVKDFIESRYNRWKRLEELTAKASRYRLTNLTAEEVSEFGILYRRAAADLAIARVEVHDKRLVNYLNHLVSRGHGAIYRSSSSGFGAILSFYRFEFPAVFRKTFKYTLIAFLISFMTGAFAFFACRIDENFADLISPSLRQDIQNHKNWTDIINTSNPLMASSIQTNNIGVTFYAFSGGVLAGLGTVYVMAINGVMLGIVISLCIEYRFWEILFFISGHGPLELMAIFISGGAGLLIARSILAPGDLSRKDAVVANGIVAAKLVLGCIPMLFIAGFIEGFISPATISPLYKLAVSAVSAMSLIFYFLKPDLREASKLH